MKMGYMKNTFLILGPLIQFFFFTSNLTFICTSTKIVSSSQMYAQFLRKKFLYSVISFKSTKIYLKYQYLHTIAFENIIHFIYSIMSPHKSPEGYTLGTYYMGKKFFFQLSHTGYKIPLMENL